MGTLVQRYAIAALIGAILWTLWPSGLPEGFEERASLAGVSREIIGLYGAASPSTALPMPAIWWIILFSVFHHFTRRFSGCIKYREYFGNVIRFGVLWVILGTLQWLFGAPFLTGDSGVYLGAALEPWTQFGAHHPSGTSWILWLGRQLGLPVGSTLAGIGAVEVVLLRQVVIGAFGSIGSWVIAAAFLLYPDFLLIRLSLWSEPGMLLFIAASAVVLGAKRIGNLAKCFSLCCLFLAMSEVRHAAIFLLPGLALATGLSMSGRQKWSRKFVVISAVTGCFLVAWLTLNLARTGKPLAPTSGSFECVHFIAAYHRVPFCSTAPEIPLCQLDADGTWLQQGTGKQPDFISLDRFIFRPESPLNRLGLTPEGSCEMWGMMRSELLANYKAECARLITSRVVGQFGTFEISERGANVLPEGMSSSLSELDQVLAKHKAYVWPLWLLWICALLRGLRTRRLSEPLVLFCLLGGLGHAAGIALNNPFLGLRYLAIAKYLVSVAAVLLLGRNSSADKQDIKGELTANHAAERSSPLSDKFR